MAREMINDEMMEQIVGGNINYTWRNGTGTCGLNGNYDYSFDNKSDFVNGVKKYYNQGMSDSEILDALLSDGIIY